MQGIVQLISRVIDRWRQRRDKTATESAPRGSTAVSGIRYLVAGEAARRVAVAIDQRDLATAERIYQAASPIEHQHPDLIEQGVRLNLAKGQPRRAVQLLERSAPDTPRLRLLLQLVRLQAGEKAAAQLALHEWVRQSRCPDEVVALLSWMELENGDVASAHQRLRRIDPWRTSPRVRQMQITAAKAAGDEQQMRRVASISRCRQSPTDPLGAFVRNVGLADEAADADPPIEVVDELAVSLLSRPKLIATLVRAEQIRPNRARITLLRQALTRVVRDVADPSAVCAALAELAMLAGDPESACDWARRGLRKAPFDARLALLLDRAEQALRPTAEEIADQRHSLIDALHGASLHHPDYPDLLQALLRRYREAGQHDKARWAIERWRRDHRQHPMTGRLEKEAAA